MENEEGDGGDDEISEPENEFGSGEFELAMMKFQFSSFLLSLGNLGGFKCCVLTLARAASFG